MNEKICSHCGRQNPADMNFCLNCGQSLPVPANAASTSADSVPTVFVSPQGAQPAFQPLAPNLPQPQKKSKTGFWLAIVGGVGLILVLLGVGIVGLVAMNWNKITEADNKNSYSPSPPLTPPPRPTRTANLNSKSPIPTPAENRSAPLTSTPASNNGAPSASFNRMWVDYNVTENGQTGMRIHAKFSVANLKDTDSYLAIYFETRDGKRLKDKNQKFYSTDGDVAVYESLKPGFAVTNYEDLTVFMPYNELELSKGDYKLRMNAYLIYKDGGAIQHLTLYNFDYTAFR